MRRSKLLIATSLLALAVPAMAYAEPNSDPLARFDQAPVADLTNSTFVPQGALPDKTIDVIVELAEDPVAVVEAKAKKQFSKREQANARAKVKATQDKLKGKIAANGGQVTAQMQSAINGMRVKVSTRELDSIASMPGVKAVHKVAVYEPSNAVSVPALGIPEVWQNTGFTGKNVKVAIIDSGVDYTHATFGGPGTVAAYQAANAAEASPANPALFGPNAPRVKGGWDFVGNDYDADKAGSVAKPDPNPLDCGGHGSHVAGSTGGGGVKLDGTAYTGPYDTTTKDVPFKVGPGVAPQVDIYAYRVFGCKGSTDVTTEAIDRAVADGVNVINMSLGSSYGPADDASAIAATNAAAAGVVVVASAGNSGPNPYLTGSPGAGAGVISVAASDGTPSFPGAELTIGGTKISAINANNATLPSAPMNIVTLKDDPATPANEALGCQVSDYTKAGIAAGKNQIAITTRGTCARVARAVLGQQAGAAAVLMVNNSDTYPAYEGAITENPDTGDAYLVTIPFLGVRASDGAAVSAGTTLKMASTVLTNPDFTKYGTFSSGGPRSIDAGLKPSVTAPGVSIASAAVGTGSGVAIMSGTSMASPHVAGAAALAVQAHPSWSGQEISNALVSTADPTKVANYRLTLGGGLIDTASLVATDTFAYSNDTYSGPAGTFNEATLSFGFADFASTYRGSKRVTIVNKGTTPVTYWVSNVPTSQSRPASVSFDRTTVTVQPGRSATLRVSLRVDPTKVGSIVNGSGQHKFYEVSGNVTLTSSLGTLRVPYLLVPRADARVKASTIGRLNPRAGGVTVNLRNSGGTDGAADFYTWGLEDGKDLPTGATSGIDLRAAGVQSHDTGDDKLLVFAINMHDRYSNAAAHEYNVLIDNNNDGTADVIALSYDYGRLTGGNADGRAAVFVYDIPTKKISAAGFLTVNPTDSSTLLLPVRASQVGVKGEFGYTVSAFGRGDGKDTFKGMAKYNPWDKPLLDAQYVAVPRGSSARLKLPINKSAYLAQKPLGAMIVTLDNASGAAEAALIRGNK